MYPMNWYRKSASITAGNRKEDSMIRFDKIGNKWSELRKMLLGNDGIYYINGPETLPAPLDSDEEEKVLKRICNGEEDAKELVALFAHKNCHINLIPVNPIKERDYKSSSKEAVFAFKNKLEKY